MSKTEVWTWRVLKILVFISILYICGVLISKPVLIHTDQWLNAKAMREAYQFSLDDQTGIQALDDQVNQLVNNAVKVLPTISDPVARLTQLSDYEAKLEQTLSRHPFYPSAALDVGRLGQMREAAGIYGGALNMDYPTTKAIQEHPEVFEASVNMRNQLMIEHGIGYEEPFRVTFPYYSLLILRFFFILFLAAWCSTLTTAVMLSEKGFSPVAVARRELGSVWAIIFVAPIANLFVGELYENLNSEWCYRDCRYSTPTIEHIQIPIQSLWQAVCLLLEPIWYAITWRDAVRLSFKFRYATVASLALAVNLLAVDGVRANTIEEYSYIGDDGAVSWSTRFLLPDPGGGTWQIDWDLVTDNNSVTAGYRWPWQDLGEGVSLQPRFLLVSNGGDITAAKIQGLFIGTLGDHPWYLFSSAKLPESGRVGLYNELGFDLNPGQTPILRAVVIESNSWNRSADWKIGPQLQFSIGSFTVKVLQGFGLGGTPGETQIYVSVPF